MSRLAPVAALFLLSACSSEPKPEQRASNIAVEEAEPVVEVPELSGEWRVAKIEGGDAASLGMTAAFNAGRATLATGCVRRAWTYTQRRNIVSFKTNPAASSNCDGRTPSGTEETAYAALDGATIAIFAKGGQEASLSGSGGNLTLERR